MFQFPISNFDVLDETNNSRCGRKNKLQENITVGKEVSKEVIQAASRRAHAEEFICRLPKQYETMLIDTGQNLSGGQQQRLAIARALACNIEAKFLKIVASSIVDKYIGESARVVREMFGKFFV